MREGRTSDAGSTSHAGGGIRAVRRVPYPVRREAVTPEPGPRPTGTLGCFVACVGGLFALVVFGPRLGTWVSYVLAVAVLLVLVSVLLRILARRK